MRTATVTTWLLTAVVAALVIAPALPARAQAPLGQEDLGLAVEVGYGGQAVRGRWLPVSVTLAPTRLFAGDVGIVVDTMTGRMVESREVEVSAGSTKVFRFLAPPGHDVTVQVSETGDDEGLTISAPLRFADTFLVGVLGEEAPASAPPITSTPLDQRGMVVPVHPGFLERSSRALDSLSALVTSPQELAALGDEVRSRVAAAVAAGIDLVLVATADGPVDTGLPWVAAESATTVELTRDDGTRQAARLLEPGPLAWGLAPADLGWSEEARPVAAAVNAGKGRVVVSGLPLGEGPLGGDGAYWGRLLHPNAPVGTTEGEGGFERIAQTAGEGLRSDTIALPAIPILAGSLVLYLLLVGPVNGVVLARLGRRELAWVTIPALTVVFTAGAFVASAGAESSTGLSGRAAYWVDGQGVQIQTAAIRAPRPGEHDLRFDGVDWDVAPAMWSPVPAVVAREGGDTVMRMSLEALQVGTATAYRDLAATAPLSLDLDPLPAGVRVTVTNRSGAPIDDLRVRAGTVVERHGALGAGASAVIDLDRDTLPVIRDWHDNFAGLREADGRVIAPRSLEALLRWGPVDGNPGIVWATGTSQADLGLGVPTADGDRADDQGTFLAVGVTAGQPGTDTLPWEVDRRLLTTGFGDGWRPGPLAIEGRIEAVLRFRLPNEGEVAALVTSLDRGQLDGMFQPEVRLEPDGPLPARPVPEPVPSPMPGEPPACPPDATSCTFDGNSFEFCFPDGSCEGGEIAIAEVLPPLAPGQAPRPVQGIGLEVHDHVAGAWVPLADVTDGFDTTRLLSPLGEVYVRAVGELHPFDFSGRGIAATRSDA